MASPHTQEAAARDLARFLDFSWFHRPPVTVDHHDGRVSRARSWRDAVEADRRAFEWWRCRDEAGPLVAATTWDREVASANGFYRWAVRHGHRRREGRSHANEVLSSKATNDDTAGFIAWINDYCAAHGRAGHVPDVQGRAPAVISSQFRRTLAWFIARRPGGSIAGAIAYRHHSVQMFEGYAGTSASGFRAEVEAEQALARGEDLAVMVERHEHKRLSGPAAGEAALRLEEFGQQVRFAGTIPADRRQLAKLMARHDPHVYPGWFVTCVHNPDRALCHNGSAASPSPGDCQPLACRNVALTDANTAEWRQHLADIDHALEEEPDVLAPYVRARLAQRRATIAKLLTEEPHP